VSKAKEIGGKGGGMSTYLVFAILFSSGIFVGMVIEAVLNNSRKRRNYYGN